MAALNKPTLAFPSILRARPKFSDLELAVIPLSAAPHLPWFLLRPMSIEPMFLAPDIQEIKALLHDIVSHGNQTPVANMLGVKAKDVSNRFSTTDDRKPALFEALREAWAISVVEPDAGRKLRAYINAMFEQWLEPVKATEKNLSGLAGETVQEAGVLASARLEGKPVHDQMDQALSVRSAIDRFIAGLGQQFELKSNVRELRK